MIKCNPQEIAAIIALNFATPIAGRKFIGTILIPAFNAYTIQKTVDKAVASS